MHFAHKQSGNLFYTPSIKYEIYSNPTSHLWQRNERLQKNLNHYLQNPVHSLSYHVKMLQY